MYIHNLFKIAAENTLYRTDIAIYHCHNLWRGLPAQIMTGIGFGGIACSIVTGDLATIISGGAAGSMVLFGAWSSGCIESEPEDHPKNKPRWRHFGHYRI